MAETEASKPTEKRTGREAGHVIVCGLGRFGLRIVELLREQGVPVVIITENSREDRMNRAYSLGSRIVTGDFRFAAVRADAGISRARALVLASSSDALNLEAALDSRAEAPEVRIVVRMDSDKVAVRLIADFGIDAALSPPVLAAPEFVAAALGPARPPGPAARKVVPSRRMYDSRTADRRGFLARRAFPLVLIIALLGLFIGGVVVFRTALGLSITDAVYFTASILTTVGFGDINLRNEPDNVKWFGTLLMFGGVTLIAALSSFLTNFFLSGAATQVRTEQIAAHYKNHVIICGLGSVGFEVAEELIKQRIKVIVVDLTPEDILARNLSHQIPLLVGDATDPLTLRRAGIDRARAVIAVVSSDLVNLEIGFIAQTIVQEHRPNRPLNIVLRCFAPEIARRIHARSDAYTLLSSAEIAAPIFVTQAIVGMDPDKTIRL